MPTESLFIIQDGGRRGSKLFSRKQILKAKDWAERVHFLEMVAVVVVIILDNEQI